MKLKGMVAAIGVASVMTLSGCASIVGDKEQAITINSTPSQADVVITDERSMDVFEGKTPTTVTLRKADGSYFGGKSYTVNISKDGFEDRTVAISSSPNGWYVAGNLVFGGFVGWLIVDPLTGSMYSLSPDEINASMGESVATAEDGSQALNIVLVQDVPQELRSDMKLLGQL
ncbi:hypothetical protein [Halomonas nitroreducens]|uniref:PEGA domain-containing protein n=1 Tax=Halomonas nitroreducens TaxID=447425 RepID=A0A3S0R0P0_9GAMM|nr:hypothetical protein [Halomonas nitroreducens]RTR01971.1 hypothetical protein EKG36_13260 [Halomonas nitroreducens]